MYKKEKSKAQKMTRYELGVMDKYEDYFVSIKIVCCNL